MPILYSLVARETHVLAECTGDGVTGNFTQITRELLPKLQVPPSGESRRSITSPKYNFHYVSYDGIIYMCMADTAMGSVAPFRFLRDISERFRASYGERARTAFAFSLNADFRGTMKTQMNHWNSQGQDAKMRRIQEDISGTQDQVKQGIEKLLDRSQRLEILVDKTERIDEDAEVYRGASRRLHRHMWWKNCKNMLFLFLLLAVLIWLLSSFICGFDYSKCGAGKKE